MAFGDAGLVGHDDDAVATGSIVMAQGMMPVHRRKSRARLTNAPGSVTLMTPSRSRNRPGALGFAHDALIPFDDGGGG